MHWNEYTTQCSHILPIRQDFLNILAVCCIKHLPFSFYISTTCQCFVCFATTAMWVLGGSVVLPVVCLIHKNWGGGGGGTPGVTYLWLCCLFRYLIWTHELIYKLRPVKQWLGVVVREMVEKDQQTNRINDQVLMLCESDMWPDLWLSWWHKVIFGGGVGRTLSDLIWYHLLCGCRGKGWGGDDWHEWWFVWILHAPP